jgi:hypothetical protein
MVSQPEEAQTQGFRNLAAECNDRLQTISAQIIVAQMKLPYHPDY